MSRADFRICPNCDTRNKAKWEFCVKCGEALQGVTVGDKPKAATAAAARPAEASSIPWQSLLLSALAIGASVLTYVVFRDPPTPTDPAAFTFPTTPPAPEPSPTDKVVQVAGDGGLEAYENGRRLVARGDVAGALPFLEQATVASPGNALYQSALAQALWRTGQRERSLENYRLAVMLEPEQVAHRIDLSRALVSMGRTADGALELEELLRTQPMHQDALQELARLHGRAGHHDKALPFLEKLAQARPGDAVAQQEFGQALERKGDLDGAARVYQGVVARQPDAAITRGLLSDILLKKGERDEAIKVMRDGLELNPDSPVLHRGVAIVYERTGRIADAIAEYRAYARLAPQAPDAQELNNRADMLEKQQPPSPSPTI